MRWSLLLFLVLFSITAIAVIAGRLQPLPEPLRSLHLTDCRPPCWIGIIPGQTSFEAAQQRIGALYGQFTADEVSIQIIVDTQDGNYVIEVWADENGTIKAIVFKPASMQSANWKLLTYLGTPNYWAQQDFNEYQLGYEGAFVVGYLPYICKGGVAFISLVQGGGGALEEISAFIDAHPWNGYRTFLKEVGCTGDAFFR